MGLNFTKMHGAGNDYVYVEGFTQRLPDDLPSLARRLSPRQTGVGGDGLICVLPPTVDGAHAKMRIFNVDGSEAEMCGNGLRCVAKLARDRGLVSADPIRVETGRGVLTVDVQVGDDGKVSAATVDMGEPILELDRAGVDPSAVRFVGEHRYALDVAGRAAELSFVSMGNPHAVEFVNDLEKVDAAARGRAVETHAAFPKRTNVHFVQMLSPAEVRVVHWERGSGPTLACGTGACAVCVAGVLTGRTGRELLAHLPGGDLTLRWDAASDHVFMTGPATEVFTGVLAE